MALSEGLLMQGSEPDADGYLKHLLMQRKQLQQDLNPALKDGDWAAQLATLLD